MTNKSIDEVMAMAKSVADQAAKSGELSSATPELIDAIQSVASKIKRSAGADSDLAALVEQVQALANSAVKK